jgi:biopolymer transport protein ExbD
MKFHHPNKRDASFNLTPLIDVVFQLLIFFMLTTTFSSLENRVKVNLPTGDFTAAEQTKNITVTITEDNTIYFNGNLIDPIRITESIAAEKNLEK